MSKMNWDRVRWEDRASRQGSEWASSDDAAPGLSAPINTSSSIPVALESKKRKKKKKHKVAHRKMQVQLRGNITDNTKLIVSKVTKTPVIQKTSATPKSSPLGPGPQANRATTSNHPKSNHKRIPHLLPASSGRSAMSVAEIQKLAICLYKALGENKMVEAASLASDIYGESLHCAKHAKTERTQK
jgi:hypothetical protein